MICENENDLKLLGKGTIDISNDHKGELIFRVVTQKPFLMRLLNLEQKEFFNWLNDYYKYNRQQKKRMIKVYRLLRKDNKHKCSKCKKQFNILGKPSLFSGFLCESCFKEVTNKEWSP